MATDIKPNSNNLLIIQAPQQQEVRSTSSISVIGSQSIQSQTSAQLKKKGYIAEEIKIFDEVTGSQQFWDYLFISWIFCLIFAYKDSSVCMDTEIQYLSFTMRTFLRVEGYTTLTLLLLFLVLMVLNVMEKKFKQNNLQLCHEVLFGLFFVGAILIVFFKLIWPFEIFLAAIFGIDFEDCNQFLIEYFVAYLIGVYYFAKTLNIALFKKEKYIKKQKLIYQKELKQQVNRMRNYGQNDSFWQKIKKFPDYYLQYFRYNHNERIKYSLSTILGIYLAARDTKSQSLSHSNILKTSLIVCGVFELLLPILYVLAKLIKEVKTRVKDCQVQNERSTNVIYPQPASHPDQVKRKNKNYVFLGIRKSIILIVWQIACLIIAFILFGLMMKFLLKDHSDSLNQYLFLYFLFRLVYYRNTILVYFGVIEFKNEQFREDVTYNTIGNLKRQLNE